MNVNEARRHRVKQQLLQCVANIHAANKQLIKAEDRIELFRDYSDRTKILHGNLDALRAGIEETQKIIATEIARITVEMETPSATPPPQRGAHLQSKLTPMQRDLERRGVKFPSQLPKTIRILKPKKHPTRIPTSPYERPKQKSRTQKKKGVIPV